MQALRMIKGGNKFGLDEQIRSRQLSRMNKTLGSVGDLLGWEGESSDLVSQREDCPRIPPMPDLPPSHPSANPGPPSHTPSKQMLRW